MAIYTAAGTTLHIKANTIVSNNITSPATFDSAGYAAHFTSGASSVGEITDMGEFGREYSLVTNNPIGSRGTQKYKGSYNEGSMQLTIALDTSNTGQTVMSNASISDNDYSFKITTPDTKIYYFQAKVMSWKIGIGSVNSVITAKATLEITTDSSGNGIVLV